MEFLWLHGRRLFIRPKGAETAIGLPLQFPDASASLYFLRRLAEDIHNRAYLQRALASDRGTTLLLDRDLHQVLELLSRRIAAKALEIAEVLVPPIEVPAGAETEAEMSSPSAEAKPQPTAGPDPQGSSEGPTPPPDIEGGAETLAPPGIEGSAEAPDLPSLEGGSEIL